MTPPRIALLASRSTMYRHAPDVDHPVPRQLRLVERGPGHQAPVSERLLGASVRRREDPRLVTGGGRYVADLALPGMLHVAVHRSPHAHARIVGVDASQARRHPGVVHVLIPADVTSLGRLPLLVPHSSLIAPACPEFLPQEIASFAGQAVALVVAETA